MHSLSQLLAVLPKHDYKQSIGIEMDKMELISVAVHALEFVWVVLFYWTGNVLLEGCTEIKKHQGQQICVYLLVWETICM